MRYSEQICPRFQHAVEILGKRWVGLILRLLMERPLRFSELAERLEVVGDRMLADRLKELELEGVIERRVYPDMPVRVEYRLTEKGYGLGAVLDAIGQWSEQWVELPEPLAPGATH
ncbi:MAG: helix-turn-helix transcriptional regulator [Herpetosiphonaceae bacterium]|nr:helix-turn-helix transcriptional regulator [Herpetosiphonaceae bacterium]